MLTGATGASAAPWPSRSPARMPSEGRLRVAGHLLPGRAAWVRAHVGCVIVDGGSSRATDPLRELRDALRGRTTLVVIDGVDRLTLAQAEQATAMLRDAAGAARSPCSPPQGTPQPRRRLRSPTPGVDGSSRDRSLSEAAPLGSLSEDERSETETKRGLPQDHRDSSSGGFDSPAARSTTPDGGSRRTPDMNIDLDEVTA